MYLYNLIIKRGDLDADAARAMVNRELTTRFGPDVGYHEHAFLDNEAVIIVRGESKRGLQATLGDWFTEGLPHAETDDSYSTFPDGTLLHYREILRDEPIYNTLLGG